jgi:4-amino-4-deoxy-L-arabinose transferase-like glycosyltransferase
MSVRQRGTMSKSEEQGRTARLAAWSPWLLVGGWVLFHAANNWIWLVQNVTWTGWDKARHLAWSLQYSHLLGQLSIRSLFQVMVGDSIRPPFFAASASVMYALFGRTADVATMVNVIYMTIALAATYGIGRRWGGRWLGLVSVALLSIFPMFYAMSRYFYLEFALAAMVTLNVYLLLATEGFRRRGVSLLFGLSLGLGLLTKRTSAVFLIGPVIAVVLASSLIPTAWQRLKQRPKLHGRNALVALLGGLALSALWYLPNRDMAQTLILGNALFFIWWALASLAIYFVLLRAAPLSNAFAAFFIGASLASTWYLAHVEFVQRVALYGYGVDDPRGRALRLNSPDTYLYYVRELVNQHLSLVLFGVLVAVLLVAIIVVLRQQKSVGRVLQQIRLEGWAVLAWIGGAYLMLTFSIYDESRAFTPVLPAIALLMGAAFLKLPWRRVRLGLLSLVLIFGLLQFAVISYEGANRLLLPRMFTLPVLGPSNVFAQGVYIQLPDEGQTDRGFWIQQDVLARVDQRRLELGRDDINLGLFINTTQINFGSFNYLVLTEYPRLQVDSPIANLEESTANSFLFRYDCVLVGPMDEGATRPQIDLLQTILDDPSNLFAQAYELDTTYSLPDGNTVFLYRQRSPLPTGYPVEYVTALAERLDEQTRAGDALILTPPALVYPFVAHYAGPAQVYPAAASAEELGGIAGQHQRIFLVLGDAASGEEVGPAQDWLNQHAFRASHQWSDSLQVVTYGTVAGQPPSVPSVEADISLGNSVRLTGYDLPARDWHAGDIVPLTLFWQGQLPPQEDYQVFVHLIGVDGQPVAQTDSAPAGGSRPTSGWRQGETIVDRHGLLLPDTLPAGHYELRMGMYRPSDGQRLPVVEADGQALGDSFPLGLLTVTLP